MAEKKERIPFDSSQQEELAKWEMGKNKDDLIVGVYKYKGGDPKLGINRYFEDKEGNIGIKKSGRLNWDDVQFLSEVLPKAIEIMDS